MKMKKILSALLAVSTVLSLTACSGNGGGNSDSGSASGSSSSSSVSSGDQSSGENSSDPEGDDGVDEYTKQCMELYDKVLGEYQTYYEKADAVKDLSERYALFAVAEAKLLEQGTFLPLTCYQGGTQGITRVAPGSVPDVNWGIGDRRYENAIVTVEPIKSADINTMKGKLKELKGTGTYQAWAKKYLTEKGYTLKDTYSRSYPSDPETWDILATSQADDADKICMTIDFLINYDVEGMMQPALAESWTVSDDGLTYTIKIREGVKWVDSQGREFADLKADDFVAGLQHMLDAKGGLDFLIDGVIKNAGGYNAGDVIDFAEVGIKATDDHTLVFTLEEETPYFLTMLEYNPFVPLCRSYYVSKGGKFGSEFDAAAADYAYGKDQNSILYCGPYLITNATAKNSIIYKPNESYWNKDNINIKNFNYLFTNQDDPTAPYTDFKSGKLDSCGLNDTTKPLAKADGMYDDYWYLSSTDAMTGQGFLNMNRSAYANSNDNTKAVSTLTDAQKEATNKALKNQHFRLAWCYGVDRATKNAQRSGEEYKLYNLRNMYTKGTFVALSEDVTIDINGKSTTFPAGTYYGEIVQAQITADGYPMKVFDPTLDGGLGSSDGFDGWYNPEEAKKELAKAIEELKADGLEISKENPICIDYPYPANIDVFKNAANVLKLSIEASLDGYVVVNLVACADANEWYWSLNRPTDSKGMNYAYGDSSLWGPDYGDPSSYLNTMLPDGYLIKQIGLF